MLGPYDLQESLNWLKKYFLGPAEKHSFSPIFPPPVIKLRDYNPLFQITFVGDLMSLRDHQLQLGPNLTQWIDQSDYLVANLEAPLTFKRGSKYLKQFNHPKVLDTLKKLKKPELIYLSVANNHTNDFGWEESQHSVEMIKQLGFNIFGSQEQPYAVIDNKVLIYGATEWSNSSKEGLSTYDTNLIPPQQRSEGRTNNNGNLSSTVFETLANKNVAPLNILFPHWGYEFELFPRPNLINRAEQLTRHWDAIIGHHSHCPQPISILKNSMRDLCPVAYSLGNFAIGYKKDLLNYGLIMNLSIGTAKKSSTISSPLVIGGLSWNFLKIDPLPSQTVFVELSDNCPYF